MTALTAWLLGEPCPGCGTELTLFDDGTSPARAECDSCGHGEVRVTSQAGGDGR